MLFLQSETSSVVFGHPVFAVVTEPISIADGIEAVIVEIASFCKMVAELSSSTEWA